MSMKGPVPAEYIELSMKLTDIEKKQKLRKGWGLISEIDKLLDLIEFKRKSEEKKAA